SIYRLWYGNCSVGTTMPLTKERAMKHSDFDLEAVALPTGVPGEASGVVGGEETLVADPRAGLSPAQMVERKLVGGLKSAPLFVSHLQRAVRGRGPTSAP